MAGTTDRDNAGHEEISALLPAYALDALDAPEREAVERHLDACAECRREVAELRDTTALLAFAAPPARPRPEVKAALFERVAALLGRAAGGTDATVGQSAGAGVKPARTGAVGQPAEHTTQAPVLSPQSSSRRPARRSWARLAPTLAAVAAAVLLLLWNVALQRRVDALERQNAAQATAAAEDAAIAHLLYSPTAAHALTDSDLTPRPVGYIYTDPTSPIALMLAYRMPQLPPGLRYQLWLIAPDGSRDSGGLFTVDANGNGQMVIHAPAPFGKYRAIGVSAEPWDGSPTPTSPRVVGGSIQ
jgi:anti-sigma-K factor RskA